MEIMIIKATVLLVASIAFLYAITRTDYEECDHEDCVFVHFLVVRIRQKVCPNLSFVI